MVTPSPGGAPRSGPSCFVSALRRSLRADELVTQAREALVLGETLDSDCGGESFPEDPEGRRLLVFFAVGSQGSAYDQADDGIAAQERFECACDFVR